MSTNRPERTPRPRARTPAARLGNVAAESVYAALLRIAAGREPFVPERMPSDPSQLDPAWWAFYANLSSGQEPAEP